MANAQQRVVWHLFIVLAACDDRTQLVPVESTSALECVDGTFALARAAPSVMLVLDRSGSMSATFGATTRWATLTDALARTLPAYDGEIELGAYLYPAASTASNALNQCALPTGAALAPATNQVAGLVGLMRASAPQGATPSADALEAAATLLEASASSTRALALVLATDGAPNCNAELDSKTCVCTDQTPCTALRCLDHARTAARMSALASRGVPTWVIGIATDASLSAVLDTLAQAGGRPNAGSHAYFSASSARELDLAFSSIQSQLRSCTFHSPSVPTVGSSVSVALNGVSIEHDASGVDGWLWGSMARGEIVLRGSACTQAMSDLATVTVTIQCATATNTVSNTD